MEEYNYNTLWQGAKSVLVAMSTGRLPVLLHWLIVSMVLCSAACEGWADTPATRSQDDSVRKDSDAIIAIVRQATATPVRSKKQWEERNRQCDVQLEPYRQRWEAMFLAAGKLGPGRNDMLMPMLASQGKSVVPKCVHLLTGNPDASLDIAVRVTRIVGNEAIPTLIEQYSGSAAVLVRHYIVFSVKEILTKPGRKKPNADGLLQWAIGLSDEKDDAVAAIALRIMHALLTKDNAVNIEPVLKAKLDDPRLAVRIAATDILTQVCPKADYVMKHVLASSLTTKELMDREMSIRCCARLPESEDTLNVIYECAFDKNERVRAVAQQTLASMGSRTLPLASKMLKKLQEGNTDSLPAILTVLKNSKERWSEIEDAVVKYLSNGNPRIRGFCLDFLANHPLRDETVRKMIELLADTDKQVRISALRSLHTFRQKTFVTSAILDRKTKETDAGVKKLLDSFSSEISATTEPH